MTYKIIGSAFGLGAKIYSTAQAPRYLRETFKLTEKLGPSFQWDTIASPLQQRETVASAEQGRNYEAVLDHAKLLAFAVHTLMKDEPWNFPVVIGGDHSSAIGTWSGVVDVLDSQENFGLIWMDAHMDAHILETSPSKSYHGMPVATLLGLGDRFLTSVRRKGPKIKPEHLVLIGIRSYEAGEQDILNRLGVRVFYMEEVQQKGIKQVFEEALGIVTKGTKGFGVSLDLDAFDPQEVPGVGSPEPNGLNFAEVKKEINLIFAHQAFKALELTEFNPTLDQHDKTAEIIQALLQELERSR